ncbi:protein MOR1 [Tanacetum coccineum]|uniref:Protein MOR1 n=1 Tax=Tanacetum coccineum TaxID=301880 RepID=A0ABQ5FU11_9ASTR
MKIGGFFLRLFTKNCHLLTTRTLDDEVARGLKAIRTFKVPNQNSGKTAAKKAAGLLFARKQMCQRAEMTLESRLGFLIQQDTITHLKSAALKEPLEDVMPAVLSVVEAECEKILLRYGEAAAPKKTVMASDSVSFVFGGGLDSLPREANSGKITPELLKGLECSDWKMRFESIEAVKIVEEANKRIQPTGTVELFGALRARLYDSNQNLIMATLTSISGLPSAMGPAIQKSSKGIVSDIVKCIGDNNKHMGECTLATFGSWVASTDLDKVQYITPSMNPSMTDDKLGADGRTDLFDGLSKQLAIQLRPKIGKSKRMDARTFQTLAAAKMLTPTGPTGQTHWGDSMANNPMPATHFADVQLKVKRLTDADQSMKATSKIKKSNGYGSKPESRAVSLRGVSAMGSKAESIMSVQDIFGPVGSRLAFTPTEPQRERHTMAQPSVIGPTGWNEATPTVSHYFRNTVSRLHSYPDHITPIAREIQAPCRIISGFKSTQNRFTLNIRKKSSLDVNMLKYYRAKERSREHMALLNKCGLIPLAIYYLWLVVLLNAQIVQLQSVEGMKVVCQEFEAISKDLEVHLVDDLITDADRLVSCLAAKVLLKYRLLLLKYRMVMPWRLTNLILLLEFIHSTLKKGFNHVEAKGFEFLAPTTRRNSMRVLRAMQLKNPVLLGGSPGVGKTFRTSPWKVFWAWFTDKLIKTGYSGVFQKKNSWPETNV